LPAVTGANAVDDFDAARRADAAGRAFGAGFDGAEFHRVACLPGQIHRVVEGDDAAVAEPGADGGEGFVVEQCVELRFRQIGAQRPADLHRAQRPARARAAAEIVEQFAQAEAEGHFDQAAVFDVAGQLEGQRAARPSAAKVAVGRRPLRQDVGHAGEGNQVVDQRRLAEQAGDRRQRRLGADDAALAFDAFQQRGFLAADIGTGAHAHFDREIAEKVPGSGQRRFERRDRVRILGADVDVALRCANREAGDRHAFEQAVGIPLHQHAVGEGARIALVGIADDVFLRCRGGAHGLPLDAGRKGGATAAAQARLGHGADDFGRRHGPCAAQALAAAARDVVGQRTRIDDADAPANQALLARQPGNLFGRAETQRMDAAGQETRGEQPGHLCRRDRTIGDATPRRGDFDQRLEPDHAARTVAHQLDGNPASCRFFADGRGNGIGAEGQRGGITRDEDRRPHDADSSAAISASNFSSVTRACSVVSSTCTDGPQAHKPRQYTGSSVIPLPARRSRACSASASPPTAWQASAQQTRTTWRPGGVWRKWA
jgi:hypothetical protein